MPTISSWRELALWLASAVLMYFVIPALRDMAKSARLRADAENVSKKQALLAHVTDYIFSAADAIAEQRFPIIAQKVLAGQLKTPDQVKNELQTWGVDLKASAIDHFKQQDIDIASELGEQTIEQLIRIAADKVSPLPGIQTSSKIIEPAVASAILNQGLDYVRQNTDKLVCKACLPPCDTCPLQAGAVKV